jgi:capsular exopolysaccharide synthesis family protein
VAITSSVPCEGKSLLNVLLAKTISEMGQRVLLVDADLRKPQIHCRLGLENRHGLSDLLTNSDLDWREVVQPVPNYEGWSVITAGPSPADPPRLLGSNRMADLVAELGQSQAFDLILYDTPQALGLADAPLVANHLEGIVLLVSLNRVNRSMPSSAVERIRDAGVPLLGLVTNAMRPSQGAATEIERFDPADADAYGEEAWNAYDDESASLRRRYLRKAGEMGRHFTRWLDG